MNKFLKRGTFGIFPAYIAKGLPALEQLTLTWLWFHKNNETGRCWPSKATLAAECGCSKRTIDKTIAALEARGFIVKSKRYTGPDSYDCNEYEVVQDISGVSDALGSAADALGVVQKVRGGSAGGALALVQEVRTNHKKENQKNITIRKDWNSPPDKGDDDGLNY